ncbi:MAG: peptidoglycan DD-metalloendopeptidase family protein [Chitinophagaceae bacterium]|nr:peptidoglycan DD-metalloendopeptidase family protein [Chitinophagaceae bacterium]
MDFTENNEVLTPDILSDVALFSTEINQHLQNNNAKFGIGGYNEHRTLYSRSDVFSGNEFNREPRRLHLGLDIWGDAGTPVFAPLGGMIHSFAFNNKYGDYGATIILLHQLDGVAFYSLYGHLSLKDLNIKEGRYINRGEEFAHFGLPEENGQWPPHLHFQLIVDLEMYEGDYPGVCALSQRDKYLKNCPDPDLMAHLNQYILQ